MSATLAGRRSGLAGAGLLILFLLPLLLCSACGGSSNGGGAQATPTPAPTATPPSTHGITNLFFLHHSVGDGLVVQGNMRGAVTTYNTAHGTSFALWDHGYNGDGLRNPNGEATGTNYDIPDDNTDVEGYYSLWTSSEQRYADARNRILTNHHLIAFKSCFPNSAIADAAQLQQYKDWYLAIRAVLDQHPERVFVVLSPPPLHRLSTNATEAANARAFASWLASAEFLSGHANVAYFNLFDQLARANDGSASANMLRYEYEGSHDDGDSHPNEAANLLVGPALAQYLCSVAAAY